MTTSPIELPTAPRSAQFNLQEKVVLLLLTLRAPGNQRTVRDKSILRTNADETRLSIGKRLLECDEQREIAILDGKMRDWIGRMALPSPFKAGTHVIAIDLLGAVDAGLSVYQAKRDELVEAFAAVYDEAKARAKKELGDLFNDREYMTPRELKAAYTMDWQYVTLTPPENIKAMNSEVFEREKARLAAKWGDAVDQMREALATELAQLAEDMSTRLDGDEKKFKPTKLLERFDEFLKNVDARNVTDDEDVRATAAEARALLDGVDTEKLKTNPDLRDRVKAGMKAVAETLDGKRRRIVFNDE